MIVIYFALLTFIATQNHGYLVEDRGEAEDEEGKRLVVEKLASLIRDKQLESENLDDESISGTYEENSNYEDTKRKPAFTFQEPKRITTNDVDENEKPPFAVPPTDYRFYREHFSEVGVAKVPKTPAALQSENRIKISPMHTADEDTRKGYSEKDEDTYVTKESNILKPGMFSMLNIPFSRNENFAKKLPKYLNSTNILAVTYGVLCGLLVISIIGANIIYRNLKKKIKDAEDVDYPAYGVTGPSKDAPAPTSDRNLAHSAQIYHYQHQKQQITSMEKEPQPKICRKGTESGSEEDDFAVYECPGLAPVTGEMEVKNPMFHEEENVKQSNSASKEEKQRKAHLDVKKLNKK